MKTVAKYQPIVRVVADPDEVARVGLEVFVADAQKAIKDKGVFYVAISGGHSPQAFFELLGSDSRSMDLEWEKIHLFWVDERFVPPDSKWSNYKLAADTFLGKVNIPPENVHRIPTEQNDCMGAARNYEEVMREVFGLPRNQVPHFDLIVLGMGADGHTGSLFPGSYASLDTNDLACAVYVMDEKINRITVTHPVLRAAVHLVVLVTGQEKAKILKEVLTSEPDEVHYPIHVLWSILDRVTWLVDSSAAKML